MARYRELDFIETIEGKPLTRDEAAEIAEWIRNDRANRSSANRERLEAEALTLLPADRTLLVHRLIDTIASAAHTSGSTS